MVKTFYDMFEPACLEHGTFGEFRVRTVSTPNSDWPVYNGALPHGISDHKSDFLGNIHALTFVNQDKSC